MNISTHKTCPHCRARRSILIDGQVIPEVLIEHYSNGKKKFEKVVEEENVIERRWWSDGDPKYEIIINPEDLIVSGNYFTYKGTYDIMTLPEEEILKVRSNPIYFIMVDGNYL
tara:strand:- start:1517 stop:1855 length:339 start_codon:yes stop_codon:yes gene_type:complete